MGDCSPLAATQEPPGDHTQEHQRTPGGRPLDQIARRRGATRGERATRGRGPFEDGLAGDSTVRGPGLSAGGAGSACRRPTGPARRSPTGSVWPGSPTRDTALRGTGLAVAGLRPTPRDVRIKLPEELRSQALTHGGQHPLADPTDHSAHGRVRVIRQPGAVAVGLHIDGHAHLDRARPPGTGGHHPQRARFHLVQQLHPPVIDALNGCHTGAQRHFVGVFAGLFQALAPRDGVHQDGRVIERSPQLLRGGLQCGLASDLHAVSFSLVSDHGRAVMPGMVFVRGSSPSAPRRSSYNSLGEIGMLVIGIPSASSIAAAIAADVGITPASPAPLIPRGFSGECVSRWPTSIRVGSSETYGIRKSIYEALANCPEGSYAIRSYSAPPTPWATPPWICPSTIRGLIIGPQSCTTAYLRILMSAVSGSVSTITACAPAANVEWVGE